MKRRAKALMYLVVPVTLVSSAFALPTGSLKQQVPVRLAAVDQSQVQATSEQKTCPVLGGPIDRSVFVEYKGRKVYFCCKGCIEKFQADPEKYVPKLPQFAK